MRLKGTHTFNAASNLIWDRLMDPIILAKITPGISELKTIGEDSYEAIAKIKMGPVNGSFTGQLDVTDKVSPQTFSLKIKQDSKIGHVNAKINIKLDALAEHQTTLSFQGDAKLSGLLARTGQRVLTGVANALSKQFFKALEKELKNTEINKNHS